MAQVDVEIGQISLFLIKLHLIRAISSPLSTTTGLATLNFAATSRRREDKGRRTRKQADVQS